MGAQMICEAFIIAWNEQDSIHLTIQHLKTFCDKITVYDNFSTDDTPEICASMGCAVSQFGTPGELNDVHYTNLKNSCWKGSGADWVLVCDMDEILYHSDLKFILKQDKLYGSTIFKTRGFNMISNEMPLTSWLDIQTGVPDKSYSKLVIFDPKAITDINYIHGCHEAKPAGRLTWGSVELPLLHYRCVGGVERLINRHKLYAPRLSDVNRRWKMGNYEYALDEKLCQEKRVEFAALLENSRPLDQVFGL